MAIKPDKPWFAAKRYGYGAGLPISWEGWLVLVLYLLMVIGAAAGLPLVLPEATAMAGLSVVVIVATLVFLVICIRKTRGGWRRRWGGKN